MAIFAYAEFNFPAEKYLLHLMFHLNWNSFLSPIYSFFLSVWVLTHWNGRERSKESSSRTFSTAIIIYKWIAQQCFVDCIILMKFKSIPMLLNATFAWLCCALFTLAFLLFHIIHHWKVFILSRLCLSVCFISSARGRIHLATNLPKHKFMDLHWNCIYSKTNRIHIVWVAEHKNGATKAARK